MSDVLLSLAAVALAYIGIGHPLLMIGIMAFDDWRKRARSSEWDRLHPTVNSAKQPASSRSISSGW